jgi:hypothetical protein
LCSAAESMARTLADASAKRQVREGAFPHEFVDIIAFAHLHTASSLLSFLSKGN